MSKFEKREGYSREAYDKTAEDEASLKAQISGAKSADEMMEIAKKLKTVEGNENELMENAREEAGKEDAERTKEKEKEEAIARAKELEELKQKDETESEKKAKDILKDLDDEETPKANNRELKEKERSMEDRLGSLNKAFEKMPGLKPQEDDLEKYNQYFEGIKLVKGGEATGRYNQMCHTYEYVRRVAENPKFAKEMKNFLIEQLKQKRMSDLAGIYESDIDQVVDDEIEVEKAKLEYVKGNGGKLPGGHFDGYVREYRDFMDSEYLKDPKKRKQLGIGEDDARLAYTSGKVERKEKSEEADQLLKNLFDAKDLDPFWNRVSKEQEETANKLRELFRGLDQSVLAQKFFDDTIGRRIDNNKQAYMVYGLLKGTEFANKFKELESARLKRAGFAEFDL